MLLYISLEPPGAEADNILQEWLTTSALQKDAKGQIEIEGNQCMETLLALRSRCYDRGLIVNVKFIDKDASFKGQDARYKNKDQT